MTMAFWLDRSTKTLTRTSSSGLSAGRPSRGTISSTTTASECGSSSRTPSSAASRTSSAIITASGSSVRTPSGYSCGDSGRWLDRTSRTSSTWSPRVAEHGMISSHDPSWSMAMRCSASRPRSTRSVLVAIATTGLRFTRCSSVSSRAM